MIGNLLGAARRVLHERDRLAGRTTRQADPPARRVASGTRVEYSPAIDGDADAGEVVWTWVPYEDDPTKGKDRPVVVIGMTGSDLAGVPLTSKNKGRGVVPIGTGAWDRSGRPSYAKVDQLIVVRQRDVRREGGVLDRNRFDDVVAGVARHHELVRAG